MNSWVSSVVTCWRCGGNLKVTPALSKAIRRRFEIAPGGCSGRDRRAPGQTRDLRRANRSLVRMADHKIALILSGRTSPQDSVFARQARGLEAARLGVFRFCRSPPLGLISQGLMQRISDGLPHAADTAGQSQQEGPRRQCRKDAGSGLESRSPAKRIRAGRHGEHQTEHDQQRILPGSPHELTFARRTRERVLGRTANRTFTARRLRTEGFSF